MATTIELITADFNAAPNPTFTFLQGRNMDVLSIRSTIRKLEESEEGRLFEANPDPDGLLVKSSGNEVFNAAAGESNALTVTILPSFKVKFQAGAIPFVSSGGNLLFSGLDSPGAIVQINNAVGAISLSSSDIEHASFGGGVTIDVVRGISGTLGTTGNTRTPSNNFTDAKAIATARGLDTIFIKGSYTFGATDVLDDLEIRGVSAITTNMITMTPGVSTARTKITTCTVSGTLNGRIDAEGVIFGTTLDMDYDSWLLDCWFNADVSLKGGGSFAVINCGATKAPGLVVRPVFDYAQVSNARSNFLRWSGNIGFKNVTVGNIELNIDSGKLFLEASNTGGTILVRSEHVDIDDETPIGGLQVIGELKRFAVVADAGNTATTFKTNLSSTQTDVYKDSIIQILPTIAAAGLADEVKKVLSYNSTTKFLTLTSALSGIPAVNTKIKIINE